MPDPPPPKRRPRIARKARDHESRVPYAELHCRTNYSFLEGASHPDELVQQAAELGLAALAITDRNSLAGVVRAHLAAKEVGLKLLIGAHLTPTDAPPVVLLATDRATYGRLCRLLTVGRRRVPKGECELTFDDVAEHGDGVIACVLLSPSSPPPSAGRRSTVAEEGLRLPNPPPPSARKGLEISGPPPPSSGEGLGVGALAQYRDLFGDRCYALAELHRGPDDSRRLQQMAQAAKDARVPLVAAGDVHYHILARQFLHDVLTAIRYGTTVAELGDRRFPNAERHLKSPSQMAALFADWPEAVARTVEVAARCTFSLDELRYEYPTELSPPGTTPLEYLKRLTWDGARRRYPEGLPDKVRQLIEHELQLIGELRYEAYFLTVWDLVQFARGRGILCQGRGSAANSAVCYCLEVTSVDPDRIDVLFERFVSKERDEAPDIDVDFEHERREEVIQYVYEKYGRDRAGLAATVITYRPRSAVRDVGKTLGLSLDRVDQIAKSLSHNRQTPTPNPSPKTGQPADGGGGFGMALEHSSREDQLATRLDKVGLQPTSTIARQLIALVGQILGFPRHLSQHVGGMVLTEGPLCELVPIENAAMPDRTVIEWDKDDLDALGILKVDCLALGMLTAIQKGFALMETHHGRRLTLATVPAEDPAVYDMVSRADTMGVFQIESRAQMSMLPRLRPRCYYDLVIEVAIVRPGPIQGDMVHPYLRRRTGKEPVEFPDQRIRAVLEKTLGVPIFQEQAMRLAVVAAGFTPGEADQLRRAMGAWRKQGVIDKFRTKLVDGMTANGYSLDFAERLFKQIRGFGEYGFPESHAASFALLVYVSAWIKRYYPEVFVAALLNSQPMGFYAPSQLITDARKHGVDVRPVDVNASCWDCTLEEQGGTLGVEGKSQSESPKTPTPNVEGQGGTPRVFDRRGQSTGHALPGTNHALPLVRACHPAGSPNFALRLGFRMLRGLSAQHGELIVAARADGVFVSFEDFTRRTRLPGAVLKMLSKADAFGSLELNRRGALWQSLPDPKPLPLFEGLPEEEPAVVLPSLSRQEEVLTDYRTTGLSLRGHPIEFVRPLLDTLHVSPAADLARLPADRCYKVAGLVLLRQRPGTAKGITFVTLEDETGTANLIVRQNIWERYHEAAARAHVLVAHGRLQRLDEVIHLLVDKLEDLSQLAAEHELAQVEVRSRDFR